MGAGFRAGGGRTEDEENRRAPWKRDATKPNNEAEPDAPRDAKLLDGAPEFIRPATATARTADCIMRRIDIEPTQLIWAG